MRDHLETSKAGLTSYLPFEKSFKRKNKKYWLKHNQFNCTGSAQKAKSRTKQHNSSKQSRSF